MEIASLKQVVSAEEWQLRVDLAACYRLVALYGWSDLVFTHISARIPGPEGAARHPGLAAMAPYYDEARRFARLMTERSLAGGGRDGVIVTGGGPGVMEAANRGAADAGGRSIGLNIVLPHEQAPNPFVTPDLCFNFHYFAIRKMHFLMRARAICGFPGGFGTLDELFEILTLQQNRKAPPAPVVLFDQDYWRSIVNFDRLAEEGMISPQDLELFAFADTAEEIWTALVSRGLRAHSSGDGSLADDGP